MQTDLDKQKDDTFLSEINAPSEHLNCIKKLIRQNSGLFADKDSDLGHTETVGMHINTGNHPPIKKKKTLQDPTE